MRCAFWLVTVAAVSITAPAAYGEFLLTDADRVVFYGDRQVAPPTFGLQVESFVRVRYPKLKTWFLHQRAYPDGTAAEGTAQFDERVATWDPTVVVLCFGQDDAGRQALDPARVEAFGSEMRKLVGQCKAIGANAWLMTPICPNAAGRPRLQEIRYDECVGAYAESLRTIGRELQVPVLDWYQATVEYRQTSEGKPRLQLTTTSGVDPSPRGAAVATELILEAWKAEPTKFAIRADWSGDLAEVSAGQVTANKEDEGTLILSLKDIPLPWHVADRGPVLASDWPPARFYEYTLQIENISDPTVGFVISPVGGGPPDSTKPFMRRMLDEGCDVSYFGPLAVSKAVSDLNGAIVEKNEWYRRAEEFRRRPVPEPEFEQAYRTQALAFRQYADGTANIILRMPRTMSIDIAVQTSHAAQARRKRETPPTTLPAEEPSAGETNAVPEKPGR
ncbi:MAG: hypothetical protein JSV19_07755 [Phycisphaerales bacterium]|nr:MAG: hypothetical protein JSV19_07755 [Phycisphaerales bacterium]